MNVMMIAILLGSLTATSVRAESSVPGEWRTPASHGRVMISDCGAGICGHLLDSAEISADPDALDRKNADLALRARKLKGAAIFEHLTGGPPVWTGKVYNPVDGKTYSAAVTLISPDRLELKGCVVAPFCKTETWTRIK